MMPQPMKTILKLSSLSALAAIPAILALDFAGLPVPSDFALNSAFGLFVVSFTALTAVSDYAGAGRTRLVDTASVKSPHPLAA